MGWVKVTQLGRARKMQGSVLPIVVFSRPHVFLVRLNLRRYGVEDSSSFDTFQRLLAQNSYSPLLALVQDAFSPWDLSHHWGRNVELFPLLLSSCPEAT